jgi:serine protease AprX
VATRKTRGRDRRAASAELPHSDPMKKPFIPETLAKTVIAIPLLRKLEAEEQAWKKGSKDPPQVYPVVIDVNLDFPNGRDEARRWVTEASRHIIAEAPRPADESIDEGKSKLNVQYVFAKLRGSSIRELVRRDTAENGKRTGGAAGRFAGKRAIYHVWPDFKVRALINRSISTVKADAAHASFSALGEGIVWAVMDSGVDRRHPHFKRYKNLDLDPALEHQDFTGGNEAEKDPNGHGTHVAGIIAGQLGTSGAPNGSAARLIRAFALGRDEKGDATYDHLPIEAISGMAPRCKILSLRVLDQDGAGDTSSLIAAIARIQEINGYGRRLRIHGVNMSLGNDFDPEWFACGQSPLCVEVDRLVASGVVVVVSAGNSGYGSIKMEDTGDVVHAGMSLSINDPGNAARAITVGATHRDMPHMYGVSYFSSKGPTGDGRLKPDVVAPGEKIVSCAAGRARETFRRATKQNCNYIEDSGTSMAAPHVSGIIAAFLSIRREFIGQPDRVKEIFLSTAGDLGRERYFQGHGLVDLMRAIQSV